MLYCAEGETSFVGRCSVINLEEPQTFFNVKNQRNQNLFGSLELQGFHSKGKV